MTSTPVTLLSKRSGNSSDRPLPTTVQVGELAINFAAADSEATSVRKTSTHTGRQQTCNTILLSNRIHPSNWPISSRKDRLPHIQIIVQYFNRKATQQNRDMAQMGHPAHGAILRFCKRYPPARKERISRCPMG